jgi:hypothetical protein
MARPSSTTEECDHKLRKYAPNYFSSFNRSQHRNLIKYSRSFYFVRSLIIFTLQFNKSRIGPYIWLYTNKHGTLNKGGNYILVMHMHALPVAPERSYCADYKKHLPIWGSTIANHQFRGCTYAYSQRNLQFLVSVYKQGTFVASYTHFSLLSFFAPSTLLAELSWSRNIRRRNCLAPSHPPPNNPSPSCPSPICPAPNRPSPSYPSPNCPSPDYPSPGGPTQARTGTKKPGRRFEETAQNALARFARSRKCLLSYRC